MKKNKASKQKRKSAPHSGYGKREPAKRWEDIFPWLQDNKYPSARFLAELLGVTPPIIQRDMRDMRESRGLPIAFDYSRKGYYFTRPVNRFPGMPVTPNELLMLATISKQLDLFTGTQFYKPVTMFIARATKQLTAEERATLELLKRCIHLRPYGVEMVDPERFEWITTSLSKGRVLEVEYCKPEDCLYEVRRLHPYQMVEFLGRWYLIAYCERAKDIRTFSLGRMRAGKVLPIKYQIPAEFDVEKHFEDCLGIWKGKGSYDIVIELSKRMTGNLRGRIWHPKQGWQEMTSGKALLSLHLNSLAEIQQTVLSWGTEAYVQHPPEMRQFLYEVGKQFVEWYGPGKSEVPSSKISAFAGSYGATASNSSKDGQVPTEGEELGVGETWCPDI